MGKVIVITNRKGGCGKSFTTASLGVGLARQGKKVLCIDADNQDFFPQSVSSFTDRWTAIIQEELGSDKSDFTGIYESICSALGGRSQMDGLNQIMCECFMMPSAIGIYTQGYWISLSSSFVYQENGKSAIQLLLEMDEY